MKMIKNILFCVTLAALQANFCRADVQPDDMEKNQVVVENKQADATEKPEGVVENKPYITKATMFKIAAGLFVGGVAWRCLADYYGVFPFQFVNDDQKNDQSSEASHDAEQSKKQLKSESMVMHEQGQPVVEEVSKDQNRRTWGQFVQVLQNNAHKELQYWLSNSGSNVAQADEQDDDWAAKYEREARAYEAKSDEKCKTYHKGLAKYANENYSSDESKWCDDNYSSDNESMPELESCDVEANKSNMILDMTDKEIADCKLQHAAEEAEKSRQQEIKSCKLFSQRPAAKAVANGQGNQGCISESELKSRDAFTTNSKRVRFADLSETTVQSVDSQTDNGRPAAIEAIYQRIAELRADTAMLAAGTEAGRAAFASRQEERRLAAERERQVAGFQTDNGSSEEEIAAANIAAEEKSSKSRNRSKSL